METTSKNQTNKKSLKTTVVTFFFEKKKTFRIQMKTIGNIWTRFQLGNS